jgi:phosphate uptake regulator
LKHFERIADHSTNVAESLFYDQWRLSSTKIYR